MRSDCPVKSQSSARAARPGVPCWGRACPHRGPSPLASQCLRQTRTRKSLGSPFLSVRFRRKQDMYDLQQACPPIRLQLEKQTEQREERRQTCGAWLSWRSSLTQAQTEKGHETSCPTFIFRVADLLLLFLVFFLQDRGGRDGIIRFQPQQANALRRTARFANFVRMHANHFAVVRDDHHVRFFRHL